MTHLADGDKTDARDSFRRTVDARVPVSMDDEVSRLLLARMARDPDSPPWAK